MRNFTLAYRPGYYLTHPWEIVSETVRNTVWFFQRGRRGFADCDVWGLDYYLADWMPQALAKLQESKIGHPIGMTRKGWDNRLEKMKEAFITARKIGDMDYTELKDIKAAHRRMEKGFNVFGKHFLSLWD